MIYVIYIHTYINIYSYTRYTDINWYYILTYFEKNRMQVHFFSKRVGWQRLHKSVGRPCPWWNGGTGKPPTLLGWIPPTYCSNLIYRLWTIRYDEFRCHRNTHIHTHIYIYTHTLEWDILACTANGILNTSLYFTPKPTILLTGLVFLVFLEFLDSWAWDSKNLEKTQINQKTKKTNPEWTYPRFFSQDCFFCFFLVFLEFLDSWAWDSKNLEKNQINQKNQENQSWMDLPKILLTGLFFLFFLVFLEFLDSWAWDSKNLEKNQINQKKPKKPILNGLTQDSSHRIVFFFFGFPRVFGQLGLGTPKNLEKNEETQKNKKNNLE